jgi:hypothetical protein
MALTVIGPLVPLGLTVRVKVPAPLAMLVA